MSRLGKFPILLLLVALSALAAALFGALHNQLSFTVGPSYFYDLKFRQFGISEMPPRLGAAIVGGLASWWMGALVGLPAFLYGLFAVPRASTYFAAGLGAIGLVVVLATFAALSGLVGGLVADATGVLDEFIFIPEGANRSEFIRAAFMHDASYLGGAIGAVFAFFPMRRARKIDLAQATAPKTD